MTSIPHVKRYLPHELVTRIHVEHKCIRPRMPWYNGKVERSHRNDQERFYNLLSFTSFEELQREMADYLKRSNQIPSKAIGWMSPIEKRKQLFEKQPPLTATDLPKDIMNFLYENGA